MLYLSEECRQEFVEFDYTPTFERSADGILAESDLLALEHVLVNHPCAGSIERGLGGVRKIRVRRSGIGKSKGARVLYHFNARTRRVYLLLAYAKSRCLVLTAGQCKIVRDLVDQLEDR